MPRRPRIAVTERGSQTSIDVLMSDKRYQDRLRNPFNEPSSPIDLKDTNLECRWFNAAKASDHIWRSKRKGWDQVRPDQVADLEQIGGYNVSPDGYITRGERGQEVLMSMPREVRAAVQLAKTRQNVASMGNPNAMKAEVVSAAGEKFGDRAADFVTKHVDVTDTYERVERVETD